MPLQANTILLRADRRRAPLKPPLPPISHDQVLCGELATLLSEEDCNLMTMVNLMFHFLIFAVKITSLISNNLLFVISYQLCALCMVSSTV